MSPLSIKLLVPNTIGKRKGYSAGGCARGKNTTRENLQIEKQKSVRWAERTPSWFVLFEICRFSQVVFIPRAQPHAQSLFLFSVVFGINLIYFFDFFDGKNNGVAGNSIVCFPASIPCNAIWQCEECALGRRLVLQRFRQRKVWAQRHSRRGETKVEFFERKSAKLFANAKVQIF